MKQKYSKGFTKSISCKQKLGARVTERWGCNWGMQLVEVEASSCAYSVVSFDACHRNKIKSTLHDSFEMALPWDNILTYKPENYSLRNFICFLLKPWTTTICQFCILKQLGDGETIKLLILAYWLLYNNLAMDCALEQCYSLIKTRRAQFTKSPGIEIKLLVNLALCNFANVTY